MTLSHPIVLSGGNPGPYTGEGTKTYLLPGPEPVLIDAATGAPAYLDRLAEALSRRCGPVGARAALRVLLTHAHGDHIAGCPAIRDRWPATRFFKMPWPVRDADAGVDVTPLADGDIVMAGAGRLRVLHTPGHAPDHLCFFDESSGVLFSGDLVVEGGTVLIPASAGGNLDDYLASLRRVHALRPARLWPAHGPTVERPSALIEAYLAHRDKRERQVLAALAPSGSSPDEVVRAVYPTLTPALTGAARESVLAHLIKLEREGRAVQGEDGWRRGRVGEENRDDGPAR